MRVLYINPFSQEVSGPDESLRVMLGALIPLGIEAHVVLPSLGPQVPRYQALGVRVHVAPLAPLRRSVSIDAAAYPVRLLRARNAVRTIARDIGADLIHTNMEVLLEGGLAARALHIPHVLHYRGNTLDRPRLVFDALTAVWTSAASHIYCISRATAQVFERRGRGDKVEVLYNPIDVATFSSRQRSDDVRRTLGARADQRLVGTIGRLHPRKDFETFLRAAARLAPIWPDAQFSIIGTAEADVEHAYKRRLEQLVGELGLGGRVTFAGARRDMPEVMAALDVFVLCSRHEGFGRVVGEAMAAGRPIVVTDEGALPELMDGDRCGLLAPAGDAEAFAAKIGRLLAEPAFAIARGRNAAEKAAEFDAARAAARVHARYLSLTRTSPPSARVP